MKIAIGSDHRGFFHKEGIKKFFCNIEWIDVGVCTNDRSDYPTFAHLATQLVVKKQADKAVLLCGTGVGMAIVANRYKGIFAGVAWNEEIARRSKEDDNINVLVLPADCIEIEQACIMVHAWLNAEFKEGRYQERLNLIDEVFIQ